MPETPGDPAFAARWSTRLTQALRELEAESEATREDRAPVELDQQSVGRLSRMDAMQMQAMAAAAERRRRDRGVRLRHALARLEEGEFGWCAECGEPIPEGRLEIDPTVLLCTPCARG